MRFVLGVSTILAAAGWSASAAAQWPFYGGYHASTAAEGYLRGMGDVVRSAGDYNLRTSEAAINVEAARSANLDNRLKWTNTYFEMRRVNKSYRDATRTPPLSMADATRIAKENAPTRPSDSQLDPITGSIAWPLILRDPQYDPQKQRLEELFQQRSSQAGHIGADTFQQIREATQSLLDALRANAQQYPANVYLQARRFVEGLALEAQFASG